MVTDWNKPVEVSSGFASQDWKPARILATDLKNPSGEHNVAYAFSDYDGKEYVCLAPKNATYLRNVPEPKKKMWRAEISKPAPTKIIVSHRPLTKLANGELLGFQGWTVHKIEEVEV